MREVRWNSGKDAQTQGKSRNDARTSGTKDQK
jgi:hypothetical protein